LVFEEGEDGRRRGEDVGLKGGGEGDLDRLDGPLGSRGWVGDEKGEGEGDGVVLTRTNGRQSSSAQSNEGKGGDTKEGRSRLGSP
jgi:hypothetical protein